MIAEANTVRWDIDAVKQALASIAQARPDLLSDLQSLLETYLGERRSLAYWDLIGGEWVEHFAHAAFIAWMQAGDGAPAGAPPTVPVFGATRDFLDASQYSAAFHAFMVAAAGAARRGAGRWEFAERDLSSREGASASWQKSIFRRLAAARPAPVLVTHAYFKCSNGEWLRGMRQLRDVVQWNDIDYPIEWSARVNGSFRVDKSSAFAPAHDYPGFARMMLPLLVPVSLLEGFADFRAGVRRLPVARPRVAYTATGFATHPALKVLAADWREDGTRLANHQHGGGYGMDLEHTLEAYERRVSDRFYSWGWTDAHDPRVVPMSPAAPALPRSARRAHHVTVCCIDFPPLPYRLHFHPIPTAAVEAMHRDAIDFTERLDACFLVTVRAAIAPPGPSFPERISARVPAARVEIARGRPYTAFAESAVTVHSYLGTSWLESLALDVPTVCFHDPSVYRFRADAAPVVDALARTGVLHGSGAEAAAFLNGMAGSIESWWGSAPVRAARSAFADRYARFSTDWVSEWRRELTAMAEGA